MDHSHYDDARHERAAWNAGKKVGTKRTFTQQQIWAVRFFLDRERRIRDRALFDLASDSQLRGCELVKIRIRDLVAGPEIRTRAIVVQQKTGRPVQFEITSDVRASLLAWLERRGGTVDDYAFPSRIRGHSNSWKQTASLLKRLPRPCLSPTRWKATNSMPSSRRSNRAWFFLTKSRRMNTSDRTMCSAINASFDSNSGRIQMHESIVTAAVVAADATTRARSFPAGAGHRWSGGTIKASAAPHRLYQAGMPWGHFGSNPRHADTICGRAIQTPIQPILSSCVSIQNCGRAIQSTRSP